MGKRICDMTREELREAGRKGGIKSGESKRRKKDMRETLEILLSMPMHNGKVANVDAIKSFSELKGKNISVETALMVTLLQKALKGDVTAAQFIRDTSGQKPTDDVNLTGAIPVVISGEEELED